MSNYDDLMASMLKPTKPVENIESIAKEETLAKAAEVLKSISNILEAQGKSFDDVLDELKTEADVEEKKLDDIKKEIKKGNKTKRSDKKSEKLLSAVEQLSMALSSKKTASQKGGGGWSGFGGDVGGALPRTKVEIDTRDADVLEGKISKIGGIINSSTKHFAGGILGGATVYGVLTKGMIADEYEFAAAMNLIAYQTEGITKEAYGMQKAFRQTGDVVSETGYDLTTFQENLVQMAKKGIKDSVKITKIGLGLGKIMGLTEHQASDVAGMFGDWSRKLGFSKTELAGISRSIQDIARTSGLVGEELMMVVKESETYLNNMRAAGTLTTESAENIIGVLAEARKLGVAEEVGRLTSAMATGAALVLEASEGTRTLLINAAAYVGKTDELLNGTLLNSKKGLKSLSEGLEQTFRRLSGGFGLDEIEKMTARQKSDINFVLKGNGLPALNDFKRIFDSFNNESKSFKERMDDINAELGKHATAEEKLNNVRKKQELLMSRSFKFSSELASAADTADTFDEALENMQRSMGSTAWEEKIQDLVDVTAQFDKGLSKKVLEGDTRAISEAMAVASAQSLKQSGGPDYVSQVQKAVRASDLTGLRELQEQIDVAQQKRQIEVTAETDPIGHAILQLKKVNETIRDYVGEIFVLLTSMLGANGILTLLVASMFATPMIKFFNLLLPQTAGLFGMLFDKVGGLFGMVGSKLGGLFGSLDKKVVSFFGQKAASTVSNVIANPAVDAMAARMSTGTVGVNSMAAKMSTGTIGGTLTNKTVSTVTASAAEAGNAAKAATAATSVTSKAAGIFSKGAKLLGKVSGPLSLLIGAISGYMESSEAGVTAIEGILYGAITGGAQKGSMFSGMLGLEKGGAADLSLGVAGTGAVGALTGAAIGSIIPVVGTAVGALIGGALGVVVELVKIFRDQLASLGSILMKVINFALTPFIMAMKLIGGVIYGALSAIYEIGAGIADAVYSIFEPFGEVFAAFGEIINAITAPFDILWGDSKEAIDVFTIVSQSIRYLGKIVGNVFRFMGETIGAVVRFAITPLVQVFKTVAAYITAVKDTFSGLVEIFLGLINFDFNQIQSGVAKFFFSIPLMLMSAVEGFIGLVPKMFRTLFGNIKTTVSKYFGKIISPISGVLSTIANIGSYLFKLLFPINLISNGLQFFINLLGGLKNWFVTPVVSTFETIKNKLFGFASAIGETVKKHWFDIILTMFLGPLGALMYNYVIGPIGGMIINAFMWVGQTIYDGIVGTFGYMSELFGGFVDKVKSMLTWIFGDKKSGDHNGISQGQIQTISDMNKKVSETGSLEEKEALLISRKALKGGIEKNIASAGWFESVAADKKALEEVNNGITLLEKSIEESKKAREAEAQKELIIPPSPAPEIELQNPRLSTPPVMPSEIHEQLTGKHPGHEMGLLDAGVKYGGPEFANSDLARSAIGVRDNLLKENAKREKKTNQSVVLPPNAVIPPETPEPSVFEKTINKQRQKYRNILSLDEGLEPAIVEQTLNAPEAPVLEKPEISAISTVTGEAPVKPEVMPIPSVDLQREVQKEQTNSNEVALAPKLSEMVNINDSQLEFLMLMHDDLQELIKLMKPSSNLSGNTSNRLPVNTSRVQPKGSPNFYTWQFGRYDQNASQNVITDGR